MAGNVVHLRRRKHRLTVVPSAPPPKQEEACSFCGRKESEVAGMVYGAVARICDRCVGACVQDLAKRNIGLE